MPYSTVHIRSDDGVEETFNVRIPIQGVIDWLVDREGLRASGRPDRPPDVDMHGMRVWIRHPGEEQMPFFAGDQQHASSEALASQFPIAAWAWRSGTVVAKLLVTGEPDGGFIVHGHIDDMATGIRRDTVAAQFDADRDPDFVGDAIEEIVMRFGDLATDPSPTIITPTEYAEFLAEMELAEAEVARGGWVLPEGPIQ